MELFALVWLLGYFISSFIMIDHTVVEAYHYDKTDKEKMEHNLMIWYIVILTTNLILWPKVFINYWRNRASYKEERETMRLRSDEKVQTR